MSHIYTVFMQNTDNSYKIQHYTMYYILHSCALLCLRFMWPILIKLYERARFSKFESAFVCLCMLQKYIIFGEEYYTFKSRFSISYAWEMFEKIALHWWIKRIVPILSDTENLNDYFMLIWRTNVQLNLDQFWLFLLNKFWKSKNDHFSTNLISKKIQKLVKFSLPQLLKVIFERTFLLNFITLWNL